MKKFLLAVAFVATASAASAQSDCITPTLKLYHQEKELNKGSDALPAVVSLVLQNNPACPAGNRYEIITGRVYLIRGPRVLKEKVIAGSQANLAEWLPLYQPGDKLTFQLTNVVAVSEKEGKKPLNEYLVMSLNLR